MAKLSGGAGRAVPAPRVRLAGPAPLALFAQPARLAVPISRVTAGAGLLGAIALLPWLSPTPPELAVLRARSAEQEPTPEVLAAIRHEIGTDSGPAGLAARFIGGLLRGDGGTSWVSGQPVLPAVVHGFGISLTLMAAAIAVALPVAAALAARTCWLGASRRLHHIRTGAAGALLAAVPEFLLGTVLVAVFAVQLGWAPALGWTGPAEMILPALALGVPAGAVLGRLLDDALPAAFAEPWARTWTAAGLPPGRVAVGALARTVPALLPQLAMIVVGLTGGAVAVESLFAIPGLGHAMLNAAIAQDLPVLQAGALALVLLAAVVAGLARLGQRSLLGPALRDGDLPPLVRPRLAVGRRGRWLPVALLLLLATVIAAGLLRDPLYVELAARNAAPSTAYPLGADALGRDVLARLGHGALRTAATAVVVGAATLVLGVAIGLLPRASAGPVEVANAIPPVLAGLLVAGAAGRGPLGAALAVTAVGWAALAAHTAALLEQERASAHIAAAIACGAGRWHLLRRHLLPAIVPPVARHAVLRIPAIALTLAAFGFLGLGAQPPTPEWGRLLAENLPYAERAPWAVLAPAAALALLGTLAVTLAALPARERGVRAEPTRPATDPAAHPNTSTAAVPIGSR